MKLDELALVALVVGGVILVLRRSEAAAAPPRVQYTPGPESAPLPMPQPNYSPEQQAAMRAGALGGMFSFVGSSAVGAIDAYLKS